MLSRALGFIRDLVIAAKIGAGPVGDAFQTALMFPNLFRRVFAEGAFSQAFVPVYARTREGEGEDVAARIAGETLSVLFAATAALVILAQIAMPAIMFVFFFGYRDDAETFPFAILLTQITMPYLACMAMAALFQGVLNSLGRFALAAGAPILLNLFLLIAALSAGPPREAALYCAIAVCAAGFAQAGMLFWGVKRTGLRFGFRAPKLTPDVKRIIALAIPGAIAASGTQVNLLISQILASLEVGARSWLSFADRLYQLPISLAGVALGLAILPSLSKAARRRDGVAYSQTLDQAVLLALGAAIPAGAALMAVPGFLTDALFARGAFTAFDAEMTALALFHFGWGVPAFVLIKVLTPPFFAKENTKTPMRYALVGVAVNTVIGAALFFYLQGRGEPGFVGLAIATSLAAWLNVALLAGGLLRMADYAPGGALWRGVAKIAIAVGLMTGLLVVAQANRIPWEASVGGKEVYVALVVLSAGCVYIAGLFATGALKPADLRAAIARDRAEGAGGSDLEH